MGADINLKKLTRFELDHRMKTQASKERELLRETLLTICEIDARRLYLEMGYANLFSYLTEAVGYSAGSAQRRIDAARLMREIPELGGKLASGEIHLNQISLIQKAIRVVKKSKFQKVEIASELDVNAMKNENASAASCEVENRNAISIANKKNLIEQMSGKSHQETQKAIANFFALPSLQFESKTVQADESVRMEITLSKELFAKLNLAQELLSHSLPDKDLASFLDYVANRVIQQKTKAGKRKQDGAREKASSMREAVEQKHVSSSPFASESSEKSTATVAVNSKSLTSSRTAKVISSAVRKQMLSAQAKCNYRDPMTRKKCNSQWRLQVDHIQSRWSGGGNEAENLQVLCGNHNRMKYRLSQNIRNIS